MGFVLFAVQLVILNVFHSTSAIFANNMYGCDLVIECVRVQWNLQTRDTLGLIVLSLVERLSLSRR